MQRLPIITYGLVTLALCKWGAAAHGLTIETRFVAPGRIINGVGVAEPPPSNTTGGGNLPSVVRAAADYWESLIADDHTVTLNFGWTNTTANSSIAFHQGLSAPGEPRRERLGSLAFNSRYAGSAPFYLDPTPWVNEEFGAANQSFEDLGGGLVEVSREYQMLDPRMSNVKDMFSVAVHEIGHALGLAGWSHYLDETAKDGTIDIVSGEFAGTSIPTFTTHLALPRANMTNQFHPLGQRLGISQVDLLAVCQVSQFSECDLSVRSMYPIGDGNLDNDVDGEDYLAWQASQSPTALVAFELRDWQDGYGSPLHDFGDFNHDREFNGQDFLDWQRGESPTSLSDADLAMWDSNFGSLQFAVGDYNHDRAISGEDFLAWQRGRSPAAGSLTDLEVWRAAYFPPVASLGTAQVPEPSTTAALLAATLTGCVIRSR